MEKINMIFFFISIFLAGAIVGMIVGILRLGSVLEKKYYIPVNEIIKQKQSR